MFKIKYKLFITLFTFSLFNIIFCVAREGMWQPSKLKRQEADMKALGLNIPVETLYNDQGNGLNNAVVLFGRGCTGEIVSPQGLVFTNHHCGYGTVQALSSSESNYLTNGFWAKNFQEEIPCPGLTVSIVRKTEEVTDVILKNISDTLNESDRNALIQQRIDNLEKGYQKITGLEAQVKPFYNGNQYWISLSEVYKDVRLVGFPPNGIGKFGADSDNWMWPRMTGDFAVFRIYADKDNNPAEYHISNVPYKAKQYFKINTAGYKEGDFTMVYGFPFVTQQYITSYELNRVQYIMDPIRIEVREKKLAIWDSFMRADPNIFLKYAAKQSSVSNGYKKWQGEIRGLELNDVIGQKQEYEKKFQQIASSNEKDTSDRLLLTKIQANVNGSDNALIAEEYLREAVFGVEIIQQASYLDKLLNLYRSNATEEHVKSEVLKMKNELIAFYKNYWYDADKRVFEVLMPLYMQQGELVVAPGIRTLYKMAGNSYTAWSSSIFNQSYLASEQKAVQLLENFQKSDTILIKEDPAYLVYEAAMHWRKSNIAPSLIRYNNINGPLSRNYLKKQMQLLSSGRNFYPDANQTLRLSYGQVSRIDLQDNNIFQTTMDDLIPRHDSQVEEFNIPQGLRNLYLSKNYGRWSESGTVPINFIATNHTSGGNSGSPVLNGKGELIGINFDRIWQGTMSDIFFDERLCRNISVDIRYVLFIIEKYGNAGWLLEEMSLVK